MFSTVHDVNHELTPTHIKLLCKFASSYEAVLTNESKDFAGEKNNNRRRALYCTSTVVALRQVALQFLSTFVRYLESHLRIPRKLFLFKRDPEAHFAW